MQMAWFSDPRASVRAGAPGSPVSAALPVEASRGLKLVGGGGYGYGFKKRESGKVEVTSCQQKPSSNLISVAEWCSERGIKPTRGGKAQCTLQH